MALPVLAALAAVGYANVARVVTAVGFVATVITSFLAITSDYEAEVNSLIGNLGAATVGEYSADIWMWASLAGAPSAFGILVTALSTRVLVMLATWAISALS